MEGEKDECGYDKPGITWKKDLKGRGHRQQICLFDCIYSFSHKPTFHLQIIFRCLLKLTAREQTQSQEQANYPQGQRFQNLKVKEEEKKN